MNGDAEAKTSWKAWTVIGTCIAAIPVLIALDNVHITGHDERYPLRDDVYTKADADALFAPLSAVLTKADAVQIKEKVDGTVDKLDYLVKAQARRDIRDLDQELQEHILHDNGSLEWRRERVRLQNDLEDAKNYYECLRLERGNCESEK